MKGQKESILLNMENPSEETEDGICFIIPIRNVRNTTAINDGTAALYDIVQRTKYSFFLKI